MYKVVLCIYHNTSNDQCCVHHVDCKSLKHVTVYIRDPDVVITVPACRWPSTWRWLQNYPHSQQIVVGFRRFGDIPIDQMMQCKIPMRRYTFLRHWVLKMKRVICHNRFIIMDAMASQITSVSIVYSTIYSGADKRKHQSSALLAICAGNSPVIAEFPAQLASKGKAENVSIWWSIMHLYTGHRSQCSKFGRSHVTNIIALYTRSTDDYEVWYCKISVRCITVRQNYLVGFQTVVHIKLIKLN